LPNNRLQFSFIKPILAPSKLARVDVYKEAKNHQNLVGYITLHSSVPKEIV